MPPDARLINLDSPEWQGCLVLLHFDGRPVVVSRERLQELLKNEQRLSWALAQPFATAPSADTAGEPAIGQPQSRLAGRTRAEPARADVPPAPAIPVVSHASLSHRIKRIFDQSLASKQLRATHAGMLEELLDGYDWVLPDHPATKLSQHLRRMAAWPATDAALRAKIEAFLERYTRAREEAPSK